MDRDNKSRYGDTNERPSEARGVNDWKKRVCSLMHSPRLKELTFTLWEFNSLREFLSSRIPKRPATTEIFLMLAIM